MFRVRRLIQVVLVLACSVDLVYPWTAPLTRLTDSVSIGYQRRVAADPSFPVKSATELLLAAGTQLTAEWNRRGGSRLVPELDFVVAGVLTAMIGKYYSMWRVAPSRLEKGIQDGPAMNVTVAGIAVPTNAFQPMLLDGTTRPSLRQRVLSLVVPVPSLFKAGMVASMLGYGFTALLIALRAVCVPTYVAATRNMNVMYASVYTGVFLATVSNIRYQILQGVIEPMLIDRLQHHRLLHATLTFVVRWANGVLGSVLAIAGMRLLGLQQLKN